ncbi:serine/threonine-protein kinase pim-2-like [Chaetodon trifascialis]|uniref:serine/threonine-protein kinase pim-2-like n=1 Tax=Chaetodon trifascialis TaxID=109706 RepID=UPI003994F13A
MRAVKKGKDADVAGSPSNIQGRGDISDSTDPSVSVRKRKAGDDGGMPRKRMRCSSPTYPTLQCGDVEDGRIRHGKRKASADAGAPKKRSRCSNSPKRKPSDDGEATHDRRSCGSDLSICSTSDSFMEMEDVSCDDNGQVIHNSSSASAEEEAIYQISSSGNTSRAEFENKYHQLDLLARGGFGSVYDGFRKSDLLQVAIKHVPSVAVTRENVYCNGSVYNIIVEVASMLKTAGLPGSAGQSAAVSLLDWYILDQELVLVMEKPVPSMSLPMCLYACGGAFTEDQAKMILRQLVDAAIVMHSKGVFHRDIKTENVLVQFDSPLPRVRIIDFGCSSFSVEAAFHSLLGTPEYFPPEWTDHQVYWARPTTVWQLGALVYQLLPRHEPFTTMDFIQGHIQVNSALSTEVKTLLSMCLARNLVERATLEQLQLKLSSQPT